MTLDKQTFGKIIDRLSLTEEVRIADIPDIDLYMDQMLTFLNGKLASLKRDPEDKLLTKTMINNYTKQQLLMPPKNKKYNKEHVLLLILIYQLKNVLSITDIQHLFHPILKDMTTTEDDVMPLVDIYTTFLDLKKEQFDEFCGHFGEKISFINQKTQGIDSENNRSVAELFLTVLMLIAQANVAKRLAQEIIDGYFATDESID
ncbi:MAG TPA: DUF1836 domain-containing protein [Selenomonadales bacterium]|nr:DUF1836 domain-containing protein [Selenomonadales bacterium]